MLKFLAKLSLIEFGLVLLLNSAANAKSPLPPCPKDEKIVWNNCQGTRTWLTGEKYVGEFRDGNRNGYGTNTLAGEIYVGEWKDDKGNGQGTMTWPDGEKYVGEFRDGKKDGQGTIIWPDGEKYTGEWRDDKINGQGTYSWPSGRKYIGGWKENYKYGYGTEIDPDGSKDVGEWKDNKKNGHVTVYMPDGTILLSGIFVNDILSDLDEDLVTMKSQGGIYIIPVLLNGIMTLDAIIDTGASDVSIPSDVVSVLLRSKTITDEDFLDVRNYVMANGIEVPSLRFRIRSLQVGGKIVENVTASKLYQGGTPYWTKLSS
jgi:hypothetical protein